MATQLNLADLISSVNAGNVAAQETIANVMAQQQEILGQVQGRQQETAKAAELVSLTQGLAEAKAQEQSLELATLLGTNPEASSFVLAQYINEKNAAFAQARELQKQIHAKQSATLANPIDWLTGQLTINNDINQYNALANDYNMVGRQIDDLVAMTGSLDQMTAQIAQTKTVASVQANAQIAANQYLNMADEAALKSLQTNADGVLKVQALKGEQLSTAFRVRDQQMQEAQFALAQQNAKLARERHELDLKKAKRDEKDEQELLTAINQGRASLGLSPVGSDYVKFAGGTAEGRNELLNFAAMGMKSATMIAANGGSSANARFLGNTPYQALELANKYKPNLDPGRKQLLDRAVAAVAAIPADKQATKKGEGINQINSVVAAALAVDAKNVDAGGQDNVYRMPAPSTLLQDPVLARSKVGQLVLKPLAETGKPVKAATIFSQIAEQTVQGQLAWDEAIASIEALSNKSIYYNNAFFSYKNTLGIPDQTALNVPIQTNSAIGTMVNEAARRAPNSPFAAVLESMSGPTQKTYNMADRAQIQEFLTKYAAGRMNPRLREKAAMQNQK